jgi:hypothetical protein
MTPASLIQLADDLAQKGGPVECRTAVSRAYYAVYHAAEIFLERMNIHAPKGDYHKILHRRLLNSGDEDVVDVGSDIGDLHSQRISADYYRHRKETEVQKAALAARSEARRMIAVFDSCPIWSQRWKSIQAAINRVKD